jgi:4-hydroxy-tetrahydrodipicolinate reductase
MGKAIEVLALEKGHKIVSRISDPQWTEQDLDGVDVAIEFSQPDAAVENISKCLQAQVPVVVGTTGWYQHFDEVKALCVELDGSLFTASNFSVGVNILFHLNEKLAEIMNAFPNYSVRMEETHHIHKKDHPSGTASTLAETIVDKLDRKNNYVGQLEEQDSELTAFDLQILCKRKDEVPGDHAVIYESDIDSLMISHSAKSRTGFALGALLAAEWLPGKRGVFGMKDLLKFN